MEHHYRTSNTMNQSPSIGLSRPGLVPHPLESFRLRFRVFCQEKGFLDQQIFRDGCEKDSYDGHAIHIMVTQRNTKKNVAEKILGTTRVIPHATGGLPTEKFCVNLHSLLPDSVPNEILGEISRLCIAREHRLRSISKASKVLAMENNHGHLNCSMVLALLFKGIYLASQELGLQYVIASMEGSLTRVLLKNGIAFVPLMNDWVDYYGNVKVYGSSVSDLLDGLKKKSPATYKIIHSPNALGDDDDYCLHLVHASFHKQFSQRNSQCY